VAKQFSPDCTVNRTKAEGATLRLSTILGQNNCLGILNADFALIQRRSSRKRAF